MAEITTNTARTLPICDMVEGCTAPITMIDMAGYVYCTRHGMERRGYEPCRRLRPHEINRLARGEQVQRY